MKTTLEYFYSLSGKPVADRLENFKTVLFAYGQTPSITVDKDVTTGVSITGATGVGLNIEGTPTSYAIQITATTGSAIGIFSGTIDYGVNIAGSGTTGVGVVIGSCSTTAIDITAAAGRGIRIGTKGKAADGSLPITATLPFDTEPANNYLLGVFTKVATTATAATDDLGSAWLRTRVDVGMGTNASYSLYGAKLQLRVYASAGKATTISNWAAAGVIGVLEVSGATTTFASGAVAAAGYFNVALTTTSVIATGAVVAGVVINTHSAAITNTGSAYFGLYIQDYVGGKVDFDAAVAIADSCCTTGVDIGTCTQGIKLGNAGGASSASGLLMGIGTSADPATTSVAAANFVEIRCQTTATSGGSRGVYVRYDIAADGTSTGEAIRGLLMVSKAVGSFTGVSGGVEFDNTSGAISGSATGGSFTMLINAAGQSTGGLYGASVIMHMGGTGGPPTMHAPLEIRVAGDATGAAKVLNAISFSAADCADAGGGEMISPGTSMGTATGTIRVLVNGAARFIPYYSHEGHA